MDAPWCTSTAEEHERLACSMYRTDDHALSHAANDEHFPTNQIKMSEDQPAEEQKKPRGRPPIGAVLVDGKWQMTEASILREAERLEQHRTQCRQRYRRNRLALMQHRPELFKKRKWCAEQETL